MELPVPPSSRGSVRSAPRGRDGVRALPGKTAAPDGRHHGAGADGPTAPAGPDETDTVDLDLSGQAGAFLDGAGACAPPTGRPENLPLHGDRRHGPSGSELLDGIGDWPSAATPSGILQLVPVRLERDLPLVSGWMNDPAVAEFWELSGPVGTTAAHLRGQLDGDGRSVPCLGVLDGVPMSYWEIYRADLDPLARSYPARPHDTGIHLLLGGAADRGRGLGTRLLRAVTGLVLANRPDCRRVVAEPDLRNIPSVAAFLGAGYRFSAEVDLPGKRAALMVHDR
ncbi:GNAT family N-acetyltransferase [Streptomyces sp. TR06-5]|uniref:GNAT family N-acetyltransferase n=1 Tax=unclassified Streptomyces TaxID=2593676 RepID=UPI0039A166F5